MGNNFGCNSQNTTNYCESILLKNGQKWTKEIGWIKKRGNYNGYKFMDNDFRSNNENNRSYSKSILLKNGQKWTKKNRMN